jgi:hypothetical protein
LKVLAGAEVLVMVEGMGEIDVLSWPFAELANESNESVLLICCNICCCCRCCCWISLAVAAVVASSDPKTFQLLAESMLHIHRRYIH